MRFTLIDGNEMWLGWITQVGITNQLTASAKE